MNATEYAGEVRTGLEELARIDADLVAAKAAGAAARAALEKIEGERVDDDESVHGRARSQAFVTWERRRVAALEGLAVERRIPELEAERGRLAGLVERLQAERIPSIDDAVEVAQRQLEELETAAAADRGRLDQLASRRRELSVSLAIAEPVDAGEPGETDAAIADVEAAIASHGAERRRLEALLEALDERRAGEAAARNDADTAEDLEAWAHHQAIAEQAAATLLEAGLELEAIRDRRGMPTRRDVMPDRTELEAIVDRVAGWRLRDDEGVGG